MLEKFLEKLLEKILSTQRCESTWRKNVLFVCSRKRQARLLRQKRTHWSLAFTETVKAQSFASCLTDSSERCVFIGPVAYNFLNVSRRFRQEHRRPGAPTRSSFLRCDFSDPGAADAAFAFFSRQ